MIVVTGATGNVGTPLVRTLVSAGEPVTAVSRRISARDVPAGTRHHQADLTEPSTLKPVLDGARAMFLLTAANRADADTLGHVLDVVRAAGVGRVVLMSSQGVSTGNHPPDLEDAVTRSGLDWTILRPGAFQSNALLWADTVRERRVVEAPFGDVAVPDIDPADIAEVAAVVLRDSDHTGRIYELTGPEPNTPRQRAAAIGTALGEPVRFVEQTRARAKAEMARFIPGSALERTLTILSAPPEGLRRVSPNVERLLGRPPRTFLDWAIREADAFR